MITLKLATTLDGRIATSTGESQWITAPESRREAHALRGRHDAVMVGIGTALADDPDLTCRIAGYKSVPMVRIVADSHLRLSLTSRLVATAGAAPVWLLAREDAAAERAEALTRPGVSVISLPDSPTGVDLAAALQQLAARGLTRVLVEGGAGLAASLLQHDLVDHLAWFHAPGVIGGDGLPAAQGFGVTQLAAMRRFERVATSALGPDMLSHFRRSPASS